MTVVAPKQASEARWPASILEAQDAWAAVSGITAPAAGAVALKETSKSRVYRLTGVGPDGADVIAKRSDGRWSAERLFYDVIAPHLGVPTLALFGRHHHGSSDWVFFEDGGTVHYDRGDPAHVSSMVRWLASLHDTSAAELRDLPDHGAPRYRRHLDAARSKLSSARSNPAVDEAGGAVIAALEDLLVAIEEVWPEIATRAATWPASLVHGDLQGKNILMQERDGELVPLVVDWEMAGWGVPLADLAVVDRSAIDEYCRRRFGVDAAASGGDDLFDLAHLLRPIAFVDWAATQLSSPRVEKPLRYLARYTEWLGQGLLMTGLGGR